MSELWEGGQHFRESFSSYPSWFLGIFPRSLALFQMLETGGPAGRTRESCMQSRLFGGCRTSEVERPPGQGSV